MKVNMGDNVYEMNIAQFAILLSTASKYIPCIEVSEKVLCIKRKE